MLPPGTVALVGAGPGDPGLLTLAGRDLLQQADVVVYDALANPRLLAHAQAARHIYAGKRAAHHAMPQEAINDLLIAEARAGRRVVRLKGGDPFVFGRGGEEAQALADAGVPFVIVPGVTAGVAAGAYAGIPVTHRDLNSSFTVVTGHERDDCGDGETTDWSALAKLPALAFYMGVSGLPRLTERLIQAGMDPATPTAIVQSGTLPAQRTVVATLATLAYEAGRASIAAPAITYVGRIVGLRDRLHWFDDPRRYPLVGRKILVTRTREQASELTPKLEALGAEVLEAPTIRIEPPEDLAPLEAALRRLEGRHETEGTFDTVIFTSANGVLRTRDAFDRFGLDARDLAYTKVAAIGPATASACWTHLCIRPNVVPDRYDSEQLVQAIVDPFGLLTHERILILRADIGRPSLVDRLRDLQAAEVVDVAVYRTKPVDVLPPHVLDALDDGGVDAACFTSGSTARNLAVLLGDVRRLGRAKLISIGPQTSAAMRGAGMGVDAQASEATLHALVAATVAALAKRD